MIELKEGEREKSKEREMERLERKREGERIREIRIYFIHQHTFFYILGPTYRLFNSK